MVTLLDRIFKREYHRSQEDTLAKYLHIGVGESHLTPSGKTRRVTKVVSQGRNPRVEFTESNGKAEKRRVLTLAGFKQSTKERIARYYLRGSGTDRTANHGCFGYGGGGGNDGGPY